MTLHTIQPNNNRIQSPVLETMSLATTAMTGANSPIARALITGAFKAINNLTREQDSFLDSLDRKRELEREKYGSFSEIIGATALSAFCNVFTNFDTPGALSIVADSRAKLGITNPNVQT